MDAAVKAGTISFVREYAPRLCDGTINFTAMENRANAIAKDRKDLQGLQARSAQLKAKPTPNAFKIEYAWWKVKCWFNMYN